jgi:hypothetical protein
MATLAGRTFRVASTAANGVVCSGTHLRFIQRGSRVLGKYAGGTIRRGVLVGELSLTRLTFRYLQRELSGEFHGGDSSCDIEELPDGRVRIVEHFTWRTRTGGGSNVFEEFVHE